jgi:PDZ domain
MRALLALLASGIACSGAGQKPRAPVVIPPIARVHFDDDFGLIFVTASVAGSAGTFLVDSGAHQTRLAPEIAGEHATEVDMFVGPVPFGPHDVSVGPLDGSARFLGRTIDGIVGYELLEQYVVTVDYAAHELAFYDPAHAPTGGDAIPITLGEHQALADVVLHDGANAVAATLNVDTTNPAGVELTTQFVADHRLLAGAPKLARLTAIRIGSVTLGPLVIETRASAGTLGAGLLQQFAVTFDYPHHRLLLVGREHPPALAADRSGLVIATFAGDLTRCEVIAVAPGSPAANSGIEVGEEIAAINGVPFAEIGLAALWSLLRQQGTVRLTIRHAGSERVVAVALRPLA